MALNQVGGDEEFLVELINDVMGERETHINTLETAITEKDYKVRSSTVHYVFYLQTHFN